MSLKKKVDKLTRELEEQAFEEEAATEELMENKETNFAQRITELEKENEELKDKYLRNMAEFENYRRRSIQEKSDWIKLATQKMALDICDVVDNFERAQLQVKDENKDDSYVKGVKMIEQQLKSILDKEGIKRIDALGKEFDPNLHEALAHIPSDLEADLVAAVIQNGYMMHDKVLRPARVAVSSGRTKENKAEPESESIEEKSGGNRDRHRIMEIKVD